MKPQAVFCRTFFLKENIFEFGPLLLGKDKANDSKESVKKTNSENDTLPTGTHRK